MVKSNGKITPEVQVRFDELAAHWRTLDEQLDAFAKEYDDKIRPFKQLQIEISDTLLGMLDATGAESVRTKQGTVKIDDRTTAPLDDKDAFMEFVIDNKLFELLNRAANAPACQAYVKEHKQDIPGLHFNRRRVATVRKPTS